MAQPPAPEHQESVEVFIQGAGLRPIQAAMFRAWLKEQGITPTHASHREWQQRYRDALTTVVAH